MSHPHDDEAWEANLEELKKYKQQNGHCKVPQKFETDAGKKLGRWVGKQRTLYKKGRLLQSRIDTLNLVGFDWGVSYVDCWEQQFELLKKYKDDHDDCLVPRSHKILGIWVNTQRCLRRKNKLPDDRITKLNSIGFVWGVFNRKAKGKDNPNERSSKDRGSPQPAEIQRMHSEDARVTPGPDNRKTNCNDGSKNSGSAPKTSKTVNNGIHVTGMEEQFTLDQRIRTTMQLNKIGLEPVVENWNQGEKIIRLDNVTAAQETSLGWGQSNEWEDEDDEFEEDDEQFADADEDLWDPQTAYVKEKEGGFIMDPGTHGVLEAKQQNRTATGTRRGLWAPSFGFDQNDKENAQDHSTECPAPKRPKHNDCNEFEYESSTAYFARKRTPFDTFSL